MKVRGPRPFGTDFKLVILGISCAQLTLSFLFSFESVIYFLT